MSAPRIFRDTAVLWTVTHLPHFAWRLSDDDLPVRETQRYAEMQPPVGLVEKPGTGQHRKLATEVTVRRSLQHIKTMGQSDATFAKPSEDAAHFPGETGGSEALGGKAPEEPPSANHSLKRCAPHYDPAEALKYLQYSRAAFCTERSVIDWDCGDMCDASQVIHGTPTIVGPGRSSGVAGYLASRPPREEGRCILAFRGSVNLRNWLTDAKVLLSIWPPNGTPRSSARAEEGWCKDCKVHTGFVSAYEELREEVHSGLSALGCRRLDIVGHSLGAAIATLAAMDLRGAPPLVTELPARVNDEQMKVLDLRLEVSDVWTFGSPRVGDQAFARAFVDLARRRGAAVPSWRLVHYHDPVTMLGPSAIYEHVPVQVYYRRHTKEYEICPWVDEGYTDNSMCGLNAHATADIIEGLSHNDHAYYLGESFTMRDMNEKCQPANAAHRETRSILTSTIRTRR